MPNPQLNWTSLNDFRAGIKGRVTPDDISRSVTRVIGVADKNATYKCWALPDGSLAPLPKRTYELHPTLPDTPTNFEQDRLSISGFHAAGPLIGGDEFHLAYEGIRDVAPNVGFRNYFWDRIRHFDADQRDNLLTIAPCAAPGPRVGVEGYAQPTYFHSWRAHPTDPLQPGIPAVVASWRESSGSRIWRCFPDPATPTLNTLKLLTDFTGGTTQLPTTVYPYYGFAHQGRACIITISVQDHGTVSAHPWVDNEQLWMTESNLTTLEALTGSVIGNVYGMENATGYSGALSTSFSELFMIKNVMGGLLLRGDIDIPDQVLRLPGVPGLSNVKHIPVSCPLGVVFMNDSGAWLWAGGETAEPISRDALTGDDLKPQINHVQTDFDSFYGRIGYWHDWVIFPNNWCWNFADRSWWRFDNPSDFRMFWVGPEETGADNLFCAPPWVMTGGVAVVAYNYHTEADNYRWKSLPLPLGRERENKIREYVLVVTGHGDVTITFTNLDGTTQVDTFSINSTSPVYIRKESNVRCEQLIVQFDVTTSGTTPIIHELRLGIEDREHMPSGTP